MRLVIDGRRLEPQRTGVGRYLETLLAEWAVTGLPLERGLLVVRSEAAVAALPRAPGLEIRAVGRDWPGLIWERWGLGRALRPDDVLFAPANLVPANWRGKTVLVLHDLIQEIRPDDFSRWTRFRFARRYRAAALRADVVVTPSRATAADAARVHGVDPARIRVIPPGVAPEFRPLSALSPRVAAVRDELGVGPGPFFLFLGKRGPRRNLDQVVRAVREVRNDRPDVKLVVVGPRAGGPVVEPGVVDRGYLPEETLRILMGAATALAYPSEYEGFGLPVVEAMACGCPVLTTRGGALPEAGGNAAVYLDDTRAETIAAAMKRLLHEPDWRWDLANRGMRWAAGFSRSRFAARVAAVIRELADDAPRPGLEPEPVLPRRRETAARA